jgi:SAM-dependent methyltransferase
MDWLTKTLNSDHVAGKRVLEVGACDVNGSVRPHIESFGPSEYVGVDFAPGLRVDKVVDCMELTNQMGYAAWDLVISTEMLEHVRDWRGCMAQLAAAVKVGGFLVLTTRSPGFPYHPFPEDWYRYTNDQMRRILEALKLDVITVDDDPDPGVFALARRNNSTVGGPEDLQDLSVEDVVR